MPRQYQHVQMILPKIQEMIERGMTHREIENQLGLSGDRPVHRLLTRERRKNVKSKVKYMAINRSKEMMEGHKMEYFVLNLSFIGWAILAPLTFGLLYIWLVPYMQATLTNFYNSVKPQVVVEGPEAPVYEPVAEPVLNGEAE